MIPRISQANIQDNFFVGLGAFGYFSFILGLPGPLFACESG